MNNYKVTTVESERGWGQSYDEVFFETKDQALRFYKETNDFNEIEFAKTRQVPDYYYQASEIFELSENSDGSRTWKKIHG